MPRKKHHQGLRKKNGEKEQRQKDVETDNSMLAKRGKKYERDKDSVIEKHYGVQLIKTQREYI